MSSNGQCWLIFLINENSVWLLLLYKRVYWGFQGYASKTGFSQTLCHLANSEQPTVSQWQRGERSVVCLFVPCVSQRGPGRSILLITTPTLLGTCAGQMVPVALSLKHRWCRYEQIQNHSQKMEKERTQREWEWHAKDHIQTVSGSS